MSSNPPPPRTQPFWRRLIAWFGFGPKHHNVSLSATLDFKGDLASRLTLSRWRAAIRRWDVSHQRALTLIAYLIPIIIGLAAIAFPGLVRLGLTILFW